MVEFLSVLHIIVTVALCGLVLIQDSKGGGALGIGGSGSNSLLGATGAQTLAATMTKWVAILFAGSCIALTYFLAHQNKSVVDSMKGSSVIQTPETKPATPPAADSTAPIPTHSPSTPTPENAAPTEGTPAATEKK